MRLGVGSLLSGFLSGRSLFMLLPGGATSGSLRYHPKDTYLSMPSEVYHPKYITRSMVPEVYCPWIYHSKYKTPKYTARNILP